jgi:hypothetical protein
MNKRTRNYKYCYERDYDNNIKDNIRNATSRQKHQNMNKQTKFKNQRCMAVVYNHTKERKWLHNRCANKTSGGDYCGIHYSKKKDIFNYDGSVFHINENETQVILKPHPYFCEMKSWKENPKELICFFKCNIPKSIIYYFKKLKIFKNNEEFYSFFKCTSESFPKQISYVKYYLATYLFFKENPEKLIPIQSMIRIFLDKKKQKMTPDILKMLKKANDLEKKELFSLLENDKLKTKEFKMIIPYFYLSLYSNTIKTIQKKWKRKFYSKSLPHTSSEIDKWISEHIYYVKKNENLYKEYVKYRLQHSYGCPYSADEFWEIPKENRVVYKDCLSEFENKEQNYWRYYNILYLHEDFLHQTDEKRFLLEPVTKKEFPETFVVEVARKSWYLTRIKNNYLNKSENGEIYSEEWHSMGGDYFHCRSMYRFSLMLFDFLKRLEIPIKEINPIFWKSEGMCKKLRFLFLELSEELFYLCGTNENFFHLKHFMFCQTSTIFGSNIFQLGKDILPGKIIYIFCKFFHDLDFCPENEKIKYLIKDRVKDRLIFWCNLHL